MRAAFYYLTFILVLASQMALSQSVQKHPRVAELERFLAGEALAHVKGRFPEEPTIVEVDIDPLRRIEGISSGPADDFLPFNTVDKVTVTDEWDDPSRSLFELIPRIKSANVKIVLPDRITDAEVIELRESLFSVLKLVYGRDKIDFERRIWPGKNPISWYDLAIVAAVLLIILPAFYLSLRSAASRVSQGINEISASLPNTASSSSSSPVTVSPPSVKQSSVSNNNVRFNDPIKIAEKILPVIDLLARDKVFPDLEDMLLFDEAIEKSPEKIGALINMLPKHLQERLFMLSHGPSWLSSFSDPGELDIEVYEFVRRLSTKDRASANHEWQELLILIWRLEGEVVPFLQKLDQEEALTILSSMPTRLSIPIGKRALPGSWAALLDPEFKKEPLSQVRIGQLQQIALETKPYSDIAMLRKYKHDKGLLSFLKTASIRDEKEVYEAARSVSSLQQLRPPFYPILELPKEQIKSFVTRFSIETWALALFNVGHDVRANFEATLSEKQRYFFVETMKSLSAQRVSASDIGEAREKIARSYQEPNEGGQQDITPSAEESHDVAA